MAADFAAFGLEHLADEVAEQHCEIYQENWKAIEWFLDVDDLFIVSNGVLLGLDVKAIQADATMSGRTYTPEDYIKLRTIGRAAAAAVNAKNSRKGSK
ncbi:hypothetical protein JYB87_11825 [Shewanella avicenniae]|uniref:Uncharacterized protein n=1 Tax=Shewanella avicenniae TaxID=2814294 RepID=A0ABX7QN94_9GAMM|nr:hypothetical protein [Shewanella avicenniae]QSX32455.1 hypothetical protein JYB87_11825 [Shewanella avicenniae]